MVVSLEALIGKSSLWIFSKKIPQRGEFVTIRGEVKTGFEIAGRNFGVILIER